MQLNIVLKNVISVDFYVAGCCKICLKRQSNTPKTRRIPNNSHIFWGRITSPRMFLPYLEEEITKKKNSKADFPDNMFLLRPIHICLYMIQQ